MPVALAMFQGVKTMWTKSTVDEILRNGDAMYLNTAFDARTIDTASDSFKFTTKHRLTLFFGKVGIHFI